MSTTPRSGSPVGSHGSGTVERPEQSMIVEHSMHADSPGNRIDGAADFHPKQPQLQRLVTNGAKEGRPGTPGPSMADFDWADFEQRYLDALEEADGKEKKILDEFNQLVEYFAAWAAASSAHDDERAIKRLQTRSRHVQLSEQTLTQKKQHLSEVVKAFQSALALLSLT